MVNYLAVLVSAITSFVIGFIWYSPKVFGNTWLNLSGLDLKKMKTENEKPMGKTIFTGFCSALLISYVLANFIKINGASTIEQGITTAFWVWLGFVATIQLGSVLWEKRPVKFWLINVTHYLVTLSVMGSILAVWP